MLFFLGVKYSLDYYQFLNGYLEITLIISNNGKFKKPVISFKGIPEEEMDGNFIFDIEDEINNVCRTFSVQ